MNYIKDEYGIEWRKEVLDQIKAKREPVAETFLIRPSILKEEIYGQVFKRMVHWPWNPSVRAYLEDKKLDQNYLYYVVDDIVTKTEDFILSQEDVILLQNMTWKMKLKTMVKIIKS